MTAMDQQKQAVVFHDKTKHIQKQNKSCKINVKTFTEATMMKSTVQEQQWVYCLGDISDTWWLFASIDGWIVPKMLADNDHHQLKYKLGAGDSMMW